MIILLVYVDDRITGDDQQGITNLKIYLGNKFQMKDLESLKYFLGIEVANSKHWISLNQSKYAMNLLRNQVYLLQKPLLHLLTRIWS